MSHFSLRLLQVFDVGDFVCEIKEDDIDGKNMNYFRIVGAFQATKSFIGKWGKKKTHDEEIQRRGE